MKYLFLFSLFLVVAKGCGDKKLEGVVVAKIGEEVSLKIGEALHIEGSDKAGFMFSSVENDSRCPRGLDCIQAGAATILIEEMNVTPKQVNIPAKMGKSGVFFNIKGARIKVISLDPYPVSGQGGIKPEDYVLTIKLIEGSASM